VSSQFDSHSKEEASTLEVEGEEGKRVGRTKGQDLQQLQVHGTARGEWRAKTTPQEEAVKPPEETVKPTD
jgi:hypothetical protein